MCAPVENPAFSVKVSVCREARGTDTTLTPLQAARFGPGRCGSRFTHFAGWSTVSGLGPLGAAPPLVWDLTLDFQRSTVHSFIQP